MKIKDILKSNPLSFAIILFCVIISGITFYFSNIFGIIELVITAVLSTVQIRRVFNTVQRKSDEIGILNTVLSDRSGESTELRKFPFPIVIVQEDGRIEWYNSLFDSMLTSYPSYDGLSIRSILPKLDLTNAKKDGFFIESNGQKQKYTIYTSVLDEGLFALYFVNDTKLKNTRQEYLKSRPAVLLITVDSLEQAEDEFEHESYFALMAEVDGIISRWLAENNCFFRRFAEGKFAAVTEKENLDVIMKNNFDLLEKVRGHHFVSGSGETTDMTVSIGVGCKKTFRECEAEAREMLDLARGRGGDQAAIIKNGTGAYFGARTVGKEKRGKVKSRQYSAALDGFIQSSSDVIIMGHTFGDFDCVGAAVGIAAMARAREKQVHIVVNNTTTMAKSLITMMKPEYPDTFISPEKAVKIVNEKTLLVITDTMRPGLVECPDLLSMNLRTVIIDHHRKQIDHIPNPALEFHEPNISSTCEMVTELVQYSQAKLSQLEAQALLAGIMLDTKDYTLRAGIRTFQAAAYLKECKADTVSVRKLFAGSAEDNIAVCKIISSAKMHGNCAIAYSEFERANEKQICSKAADELLNISDVDASFVIYPLGNQTAVSARSLGRINVQVIMEKLGGGGHLSMAATRIPFSIVETEKKLIDAIEEYKREINK